MVTGLCAKQHGRFLDLDKDVRKVACDFFTCVGDASHAYADAVSALLRDSERFVREAACEALFG